MPCKSVIIAAEAEAQEKLVKDIKAAEAAEAASTHLAAEQLTLAEARLKTADLDAQAELRLAEGIQAETAAPGLAAVQVREAEADVTEKAGLAEAEATSVRLRAEAEGARLKALATAEGTQAQASADAAVIGEKLKAEAAGLTEKAAAMAALDDASRGHEEYRLRLDAEKEIRLAGLEVQRQVAEAQATVLATGLENADIDIVGGDSVFFDRLVSSISLGKAVDGFVEKLADCAGAGGAVAGRLVLVHGRPQPGAGVGLHGDVQNLTVSALLMRLMGSSGAASWQVEKLLAAAKELGLADLPVGSGAAVRRWLLRLCL
ncbi:Flotillin OS=Streptomyces microflavus OX=1919 GN=Smic_38010 PE=4 SV=1 [Streptomyces microflavus]